MDEAKVIRHLLEHLEGFFPKVCPNCGKHFATLREYLQLTENLGSVMPYDADLGDWKPIEPLGTFAYSNCPCGNTLTLSSKGRHAPSPALVNNGMGQTRNKEAWNDSTGVVKLFA